MQRGQRLGANEEFERVRRSGRSWAGPLLVLFAAPAPEAGAPTRIGVTVGRRVGGAVARNKVRRRVRELMRHRYAALAPGWHVVILARPAAADASHRALSEAVDTLLRRSGLLLAEDACAESFSV